MRSNRSAIDDSGYPKTWHMPEIRGTRFLGHVIIGRHTRFPNGFNALRKQIFRDELIDIQSWDRVVEWGKNRAAVFGRLPGLAFAASPKQNLEILPQTARRGRGEK